MLKEEAIDILFGCIEAHSEEENEALDMAIEALKRERTDEWCTGCKEYDTEKKCCPRFNRVIRGAMKRIPHEDGTLEVKVEDATKVGRVLISDDKHRGGLYYPDEDEPQSVSFENDTEIKSCSKDSDLISRQAAIDALYDKGTSMTAWGELLAMKWSDIQKCIEQLPSADRPKGRWHYSDGKPATIGQSFGVICDQCGTESEYCTNFCPNCGADMRGGTE